MLTPFKHLLNWHVNDGSLGPILGGGVNKQNLERVNY